MNDSHIPENIIGFISYARQDDESNKGIITKIRHELEKELCSILGKPIQIFQDKKDIRLGDQVWPRIEEQLRTVPFFIPFLTPSFFQSPGCIRELRKFWERERHTGQNGHILPILLIDYQFIENDIEDQNDKGLINDLKSRNYLDLRRVRQSRQILPRLITALADRMAKGIEYSSNFISGLAPTVIKSPSEQRRENIIVPETVKIVPGEFGMGSSSRNSLGKTEERPSHKVKIEYEFEVGKFPITFEEWDSFAEYCKQYDEFFSRVRRKFKEKGYANKGFSLTVDSLGIHDENWGRDKLPLINVSWYQAQAYVIGISLSTRRSFRLLSEAEWEYCCRAGSVTHYSFGNDVTQTDAIYGWTSNKTNVVTKGHPNKFGLYHMHGLVWELVEDTYHDSYNEAPNDGSAWDDLYDKEGSSFLRVVRGGSWKSGPHTIRSAARGKHVAEAQIYNVGFRIACDSR